jgi:CMP-N,N'-diacetyllegionaminic acid synthase
MILNKNLLAIIPARGGSKRLPGKNILNLVKKPLIAWTIEAALDSKYIDRIIVSTDSQEIANISKKYGADVPFMRSIDLANDNTASIDVVLNVLKKLEEVGELYDYIILLQPTSPLRTAQHIDESVELLQITSSDAVVSVCEVDHSPLWCNTILGDDLSGFIDRSILNKRSQDLEQYYRLNGAVYLCSVERLKEEKNFFLQNKCKAYKMNRENSIDIDTNIDFMLAEVIISKNK